MSPLEAAAFVDSFKSPMVRWHFDVGNVINTGWPRHWIEVLGSRIAAVHVKEYSRKLRDENSRVGLHATSSQERGCRANTKLTEYQYHTEQSNNRCCSGHTAHARTTPRYVRTRAQRHDRHRAPCGSTRHHTTAGCVRRQRERCVAGRALHEPREQYRGQTERCSEQHLRHRPRRQADANDGSAR